ncbi:MAG: ribonuclease [Sphingopyxis sp.]|uniref:ribonuclease n=1 Tax=Sphingopyxis sp. TaxID=1908224 RepID=UPI002ABC6EC6|nr:ribonuclease [Sphingopyxis sp.]MDZ3832522.1 ribonuclease [Sphingopyxis sp.]
MAEWLYEAGIGEARAALVAGGDIIEARVERDRDGPRIGAVLRGRLAEGGARPRAVLDGPEGYEATLDSVLPGASVGASLIVEITRMALRERGRDKAARGRIAASGQLPDAGPDLRARIAQTGFPIHDLSPAGPDRLEEAGWSELIDRIRAGRWPFGGGELWIDATPAMLLIDIDGDGDAFALARSGAVAAAQAIRCCGVGGAIGIDFPSLAGRGDRLAIAETIDALLPPPFERTAVNGFGFMQIIRRRERPSLIEQVRFDPVGTDAALLLRQAERAQGTGMLRLVARPSVADHIVRHPQWIERLQRSTGRSVEICRDQQAKGVGHAQ